MKPNIPQVPKIMSKGREVPLHTLNKISYCTVQIRVENADGPGSATGFFFVFEIDGWQVRCLVTNKHVIDGANKAEACFHVTRPGETLMLGNKATIYFDDFEFGWIKHPTADLAMFPMLRVDAQFMETGHEAFYVPLHQSSIADDAFIDRLGPAEEVLVVGYPQGMWDTKNNLPIVRRGITATPMYADYEDKPEFLIDCPIFVGSSGSPIFAHLVFEKYDRKLKSFRTQHEIKFLGVVRGQVESAVEVRLGGDDEDGNSGQNAIVPVMLNLGVCIKASELAWFEDPVTELFRELVAEGVVRRV